MRMNSPVVVVARWILGVVDRHFWKILAWLFVIDGLLYVMQK